MHGAPPLGSNADSMHGSIRRVRSGWQGSLELSFQAEGARTRLASQRHSGPLLVQRAFYPEAVPAEDTSGAVEPCHVYVIHPPGGVVGGDELSLDVSIEAGAHALLTTPAAGKFYRSGAGQVARLTQRHSVNGGVLEWLPQENIFYPHCAVRSTTQVHLSAAARFVGWEIGCYGLPAQGESLGEGRVQQRLELWLEARPLLLERVQLQEAALHARWGLAGRTSLGTWLAYPATPQLLEQARAALAVMDCRDLGVACTLVDGVLCCRAIAVHADQLKHVFIQLWCSMRRALLGRTASAPRIWAT
jgi:urease accessory protein